MTTIHLEQPVNAQQAPLQTISNRKELQIPAAATVYFVGWLTPPAKRHEIVDSVNPNEWPYPPEEDCRQDWDAAER